MTDTLIPELDEATVEVSRLDLRTRMFIDGRFRDAIDGRRYVTENPATGRPIAEVAEGGPADVDAAVAVARAAADDGRWSRMSPGDRKRILIRWADLIESNARELGLIETIDAGKPIVDTVGLDMPETATCIRWHAEASDKLYGEVAPSPAGHGRHHHPRAVRRRGRGHPVELPGPDGRVEAGPGPGDRQHGRDEAGVHDVAQPAAHRRAGLGGGPPGRRPQRRDRPGRHRR